jgi:TolA-binding protein
MNSESTFSRKLAIVLIILAVFGTEISYHFTLEARFDVIEQKLQQDTVARQQMQESLDTLSASKTETVAGLNKQIEALQSSFEPLGKMSKDQTDALSQVRQEIVVLQQAQNQQVDAQKMLASGIQQLEKTRTQPPVVIAPAPAPVAVPAPAAAASPITTSTPASTPAPAANPAPASASAPSTPSEGASHALFQFPGAYSQSTKIALLPAAPNTSDAVDVRSADSSGDTFRSVRALPVNASIAR